MSQPSKTDLRAEIQNDPASIGYAGRSPGGQAALINAQNITGVRPFSYGAARRWASGNGILIRAVRRAEDTAETDEVLSSICRGFLDVPRESALDPAAADIGSMIGYLHSVGFFGATYGALDATNDARRDEFRAIGGTFVSRAEFLWGNGTTISHASIGEAMA